jgi:hypothetical protein
MSAVYKSAASQVTMTVSRLPVVAVNGPEINCINATAALSGAGSETSAVTYAWSTADGFLW